MVWAVVTEEPMHTDDEPTFKLQNVSTYDMLVVLHFLSARERNNDDCSRIINKTIGGDNGEIDFAHGFSSFTTWHRYYLLLLESELRRIAERLGIAHFTIAYWDWTETDDIFNEKHFGIPFPANIMGTQENVEGDLFEDGKWRVLCNEHYSVFVNETMNNCAEVRKVCNVRDNRDQNIRLSRGTYTQNDDEEPAFLPDDASIQMGLAVKDNNEDDGFRKRLEGFVDLCAYNEIKCIIYNKPGIHNNLHNVVHNHIGGHMQVLGTASNDPIFFLHHANIDRILESWLRQFNGNPPPFVDENAFNRPGYSEGDYLTPMFPLKTNADMYTTSNNLGYKYDELPPIPTETYGKCNDSDATCIKYITGDPSSAAYQVATSIPFVLLVLALAAQYIC